MGAYVCYLRNVLKINGFVVMKELLLIGLLLLSACNSGESDCGDPQHYNNVGTYINESGCALQLTSYSHDWRNDEVIKYVYTYTIADGEKLILADKGYYIDDKGKRVNNIAKDEIAGADSVRAVFDNQREIWWRSLDEDGSPQKQCYYGVVSSNHQRVYSFTFTPEMYDAATPINPPTEE